MEHVKKLLDGYVPGEVRDPDADLAQQLFRAPGGAARVKLADFDPYHERLREAVAMLERWANIRREGLFDQSSLVICGPVGTGKTMLARIVLWSIVLKVTSVFGEADPLYGAEVPMGRFYSAGHVITALEPGFRPGVLAPHGRQPGQGIPIVVIDDVGDEPIIERVADGKQARERSYRYKRFLDHCEKGGISVVVTSNLTQGELQDHMGPRAWDRLSMMAPVGQMIDLTGVESYRGWKAGRQELPGLGPNRTR